jgi:hypothetical protein
MNTLSKIQSEIKAPKGQFNSFGKYKYRSCEDIVEAVKPVINPLGFYLTLSDEIIQVGERFYIKATAQISNGEETFSATAFAREEESKKGMDGAQVTGASSSYARKYALNGLFAIDDTKDADSTNTHDKEEKTPQPKPNEVDESDRGLLFELLNRSTLEGEDKQRAYDAIKLCGDYTTYQKMQHRLEELQAGFNDVPNPSAKDAKNIVRKISKQPA